MSIGLFCSCLLVSHFPGTPVAPFFKPRQSFAPPSHLLTITCFCEPEVRVNNLFHVSPQTPRDRPDPRSNARPAELLRSRAIVTGRGRLAPNFWRRRSPAVCCRSRCVIMATRCRRGHRPRPMPPTLNTGGYRLEGAWRSGTMRLAEARSSCGVSRSGGPLPLTWPGGGRLQFLRMRVHTVWTRLLYRRLGRRIRLRCPITFWSTAVWDAAVRRFPRDRTGTARRPFCGTRPRT